MKCHSLDNVYRIVKMFCRIDKAVSYTRDLFFFRFPLTLVLHYHSIISLVIFFEP